jgi:hypothetical protein
MIRYTIYGISYIISYHVSCISCIMYHVSYIVYNIRCTIYDIQYTIYNIRYTIYDIRNTVYNIRYTIYHSSILPLTYSLEPYNINYINSRQNINHTVYDTIIWYNGKNKSIKYKTNLYYIEILYTKIEAKFVKINSFWHMISFLLYIDCSKKHWRY